MWCRLSPGVSPSRFEVHRFAPDILFATQDTGRTAVDVELRLLGALEVVDPSGAPLPVRGLGARLLLALAVDRGATVPDHDLLERVWSAEPPNQAIASVRNQVARLRRMLGSAVVERTSRGYRLNPDACQVDVDALADTIATARSLDPQEAAELVDQALARVRGRPLDDVATKCGRCRPPRPRRNLSPTPRSCGPTR